MRYFAQIAYNGTRYHGWQIQPNAPSVQQKLTDSISTILRNPVSVIGCGRTDTGVHAEDFFIHFDSSATLPSDFHRRLNFLAGNDIAIYHLWEMEPGSHVRFDAISRSYVYEITQRKNPLTQEFQWHYYKALELDLQQMKQACRIFLQHEYFFPFCKTHGDNKDFKCRMMHCDWTLDNNILRFDVTANRFLRGMIRLMVGACIAVGNHELSLEQLEECLQKQLRLPKPYSVPACGLRLSAIQYPKEKFIRKLF